MIDKYQANICYGYYRPQDGNMNTFSKALNDLLHSLDKYTKANISIGGILILTILKKEDIVKYSKIWKNVSVLSKL